MRRVLLSFKVFVFVQCCGYRESFVVQSLFDCLFIYVWLSKASHKLPDSYVVRASQAGLIIYCFSA